MTRLERFAEYLKETAPPPIMPHITPEQHKQIMMKAGFVIGIPAVVEQVLLRQHAKSG